MTRSFADAQDYIESALLQPTLWQRQPEEPMIEALRRRIGFVLVDMTDVHDFWETVLLGYLNSLQQAYEGSKFQHQVLLEQFVELIAPSESVSSNVDRLKSAHGPLLSGYIKQVLGALHKRHPQEAIQRQDVIRALVALNSDDFNVASIGLNWLYGHGIDEEDQQSLGFCRACSSARETVEALSWLMSLVGPTVLALDQLDPIVSQLNTALTPGCDQSQQEIVVAQSIIDSIGGGFAALRDLTRKTFVIVSCLETTWAKLSNHVTLKTKLSSSQQGVLI